MTDILQIIFFILATKFLFYLSFEMKEHLVNELDKGIIQDKLKRVAFTVFASFLLGLSSIGFIFFKIVSVFE